MGATGAQSFVAPRSGGQQKGWTAGSTEAREAAPAGWGCWGASGSVYVEGTGPPVRCTAWGRCLRFDERRGDDASG